MNFNLGYSTKLQRVRHPRKPVDVDKLKASMSSLLESAQGYVKLTENNTFLSSEARKQFRRTRMLANYLEKM